LVPSPKPEPATPMTEPGATPKPIGTQPIKMSMGDALRRALASRKSN
jgi:hypothetical protein